jgi:transcriptional pleiotropic regulator of transition state genes
MRVGIDRKVDSLGRVLLPAEVRQLLGLADGDRLEMEVRHGEIVLRPLAAPCPMCGMPLRSQESSENL